MRPGRGRRPRRRIPRDAHPVREGTVRCPTVDERIDLEACLTCDALRDVVEADDGSTYVRCHPVVTAAHPAWV